MSSDMTKQKHDVKEVSMPLFCPACRYTSWLEGPPGGLSVNIECARCGNRFNDMGHFGLQWIGHRSESRPNIVCLCGSTRFANTYMAVSLAESLSGSVVLSVGCFPRNLDGTWNQALITDEQKIRLDELHLRKIAMADEVLVINVGTYIGDSTRKEIAFAKSLGKPIRYYQEPGLE